MARHGGPDGMSPVSSMAVTFRGSLVDGRDVIRLPYFQSCSSAPDVNGRWKLQVGSKEQQMSHSQKFLILFLLFFWMFLCLCCCMPGQGPSSRNHQDQDQGWYIREVVVIPSRILSRCPTQTYSDV